MRSDEEERIDRGALTAALDNWIQLLWANIREYGLREGCDRTIVAVNQADLSGGAYNDLPCAECGGVGDCGCGIPK